MELLKAFAGCPRRRGSRSAVMGGGHSPLHEEEAMAAARAWVSILLLWAKEHYSLCVKGDASNTPKVCSTLPKGMKTLNLSLVAEYLDDASCLLQAHEELRSIHESRGLFHTDTAPRGSGLEIEKAEAMDNVLQVRVAAAGARRDCLVSKPHLHACFVRPFSRRRQLQWVWQST